MSLIVRLDKATTERYVIVNVEYVDERSKPQHGLPTQLVDQAMRWRFEGRIDGDGRSQVERYIKNSDDTDSEISAWRLLKGAEAEQLPFGENISAYRVDMGKFKPLK